MSSSPTQFDALIVCRREEQERVKKLARLLVGPNRFDSLAWLQTSDSLKLYDPAKMNWSSTESSWPVKAVFVHHSDRKAWEQSRPAEIDKRGVVFVFSSTGDPPLGDWTQETAEVLPIYRVIAHETVDLDSYDAEEIFKYVTRQRVDRPTVCNREAIQLLPAIGVLCQGYLVTHADPKTGEPEVDEQDRAACCRALERMGWTMFFKDSKPHPPLQDRLLDAIERQRLREEVRKTDWWKLVSNKTRALAEWGSATNSAEWESLEKLLDALDGSKPITPGLVAEAYCALAQRLERKVGR